MNTINTFTDIEKVLQKGYALARMRTGDDQSLDRMKVLLNAVGNPQDALRVVHIAGTSGKTSTSYYLAALLLAGGVGKVGLTVSPHVRSFAERIQLNGHSVPEAELAKYFDLFLRQLGDLVEYGSYFELLITFVYWVFDHIGVQYAVMETGLGGLHDCTNVAVRSDKVCVITDIGFDHTEILGKTIDKISTHKAGIIHESNTVFMIAQSPTVNKVVNNRVALMHADLHMLQPEQVEAESRNLSASVPVFQKRNWALASSTYRYIAKRDGLLEKPRLQPDQVRVPGRMEIHQLSDGSQLVLDSAHNAQKVATFVESYRALFPGQKATVLLALKSDKDFSSVTKALAEIAEQVVITQFVVDQDVPIQSLSPETIAGSARQYVENIQIEPDIKTAVQVLLSSESEIKLVIGSIYLLSSLYKDAGLNI